MLLRNGSGGGDDAAAAIAVANAGRKSLCGEPPLTRMMGRGGGAITQV